MSTVQVGFSPVPPASGAITGVAASAAAASAPGGEAGGESPLGFLDALLDMLASSMGLPQGETPAPAAQTGGNPDAAAQQAAALALSAAIAAGEAEPVPAPAPAADAPLAQLAIPMDVERLLGDLIDALAALDTEAGETLDPALEKKLDTTIDALATMLGITLPAPPAIDPAISAAASGGTAAPSGAIPPVPAGPGTETAPVAPPAPAGTPGDAFLAALAAAAPSTGSDAADDQPATDTPGAQPVKPAGEPADPTAPTPSTPETRLARLLDKLEHVAARLEQQAPGLSAKLQKLADTLSTGEAAAATLAGELDDAALEVLAQPRPAAEKPTAPQPIAQPSLPTAVAAIAATDGASQPKAPETVEPTARAQAPEPQVETTAETRSEGADKPAERQATGDHLRDKANFAQHLAEARADRNAESATTSPPQAATGTVRTETALPSKAVHAAYQAPVQQVNLPQVAFEVVRQFNQGSSRFQIRLDPPELGRIDVRMHMDGDGNLQAKMTVERAETLDLMQRDQRQLEKALAQAGLDSSKTSLEFSLRQNPQGNRDQPFGQQFQQNQQQGQGGSWGGRASSAAEPEPALVTPYRGTLGESGLNLFV